MALHRDAAHATLSELCEATDEIGTVGDVEEPLLFKYDDVYLDVDFITRADSGAIIINLQEVHLG